MIALVRRGEHRPQSASQVALLVVGLATGCSDEPPQQTYGGSNSGSDTGSMTAIATSSSATTTNGSTAGATSTFTASTGSTTTFAASSTTGSSTTGSSTTGSSTTGSSTTGSSTTGGSTTGGSTSVTEGSSSTSTVAGVTSVTNGTGAGGSSNGDSTTAGGSTSSATTGGSHDAASELCIAAINEYRASIGVAPVSRWTEGEACADAQAKSDYETDTPHGAFGDCGERGQDECPGWPAPPESMIEDCLALMWAEGPGGGHYDTMANSNYTQVACGFYVIPGTNELWALQNFK